ncbi:hypothetical protein [Flexivirga oryzae]|uniref:Uncharacterized protein n=1 Tax=Flexivirga oryzae TaxID=1794944 RepID=A0A839N7L7_9MICO|nr:hypothetical protein [Flexivirga oryzae]MBB2893738.1 hypothetical protein [Flexivirga oryzae]
MILVNIKQSGRRAVTPGQIQDAAAGSWVVSEKSLQDHGDVLAAVRQNEVVGAWPIEGHTRDDAGRVSFVLGQPGPREKRLVGSPSPQRWVKGAANPVKVVPTADDSSDAGEVRQVRLQGWTLRVYPDNSVRLNAPAAGGRLMVDSVLPGPGGGSLGARLVAASVD